MASLSAEMHGFSVNTIFPHIGRVRTAKQVPRCSLLSR